MEWLRALLEAQPLFALFLTIAAGYLLGQVNFGGFSFGSGAVLFVGLGVGAFAPKAAPSALFGTLGLLLFLYAVGIAYGREFLRGLTSRRGLAVNAAALAGLLCALAAALLAARSSGVRIPEAIGAFAGAGTSTAALQAAIVAFGSEDVAVGYSVAYPFGVAVPILLLYLVAAAFKPAIPPAADARMHTAEVALDPAVSGGLPGQSLRAISAGWPEAVRLLAVRRAHRNLLPEPSMALERGDVLLLGSVDKEALGTVADALGEAQPGRMARDRADLDALRVFVSRPAVIGVPLGELDLRGRLHARVAYVRRGDTDLQPGDTLELEPGDRVGLLLPRDKEEEARAFFGDSIKATAEFSYISIGLGAALGLLLGLLPIPIPGLGRLTLGLAGVLLVALGLGVLRRTGSIAWTMPLPANLVLRNFGLTIFLAQVGMSSGLRFVETVLESGAVYLLLGAIVAAVLTLVPLAAAMLLLRLPFDAAVGLVAGVTGNPAILAFANRVAPTDKPDIGYAMIFPSMTVLKILIVQIAGAFGGSLEAMLGAE